MINNTEELQHQFDLAGQQVQLWKGLQLKAEENGHPAAAKVAESTAAMWQKRRDGLGLLIDAAEEEWELRFPSAPGAETEAKAMKMIEARAPKERN